MLALVAGAAARAREPVEGDIESGREEAVEPVVGLRRNFRKNEHRRGAGGEPPEQKTIHGAVSYRVSQIRVKSSPPRPVRAMRLRETRRIGLGHDDEVDEHEHAVDRERDETERAPEQKSHPVSPRYVGPAESRRRRSSGRTTRKPLSHLTRP